MKPVRAGAARSKARKAGAFLAPDVDEQAYPVGERQFTEEKASQLLLVRTKPEPRNRFTVVCPRASGRTPENAGRKVQVVGDTRSDRSRDVEHLEPVILEERRQCLQHVTKCEAVGSGALSEDVPLAVFRESVFTFGAEELVRNLARDRAGVTARHDDRVWIPPVRFTSELVRSRRKQVAVYEWAIDLTEATSH